MNSHPNITFYGDRLIDFCETARLVQEMDLIITVDTALIHIAGSLGKTAFLMLPWEPEWRWQINKNDTPWYESVRIIRQRTPGNWSSIIDELTKALESGVHL